MYKAAAEQGGVTYRVHGGSRKFFVDSVLLPSVRVVVSRSAASHWPTSYKDEGVRSRLPSMKLNFSGRLLVKNQWLTILTKMRQRIVELGSDGEDFADIFFLTRAMGVKLPYDEQSFLVSWNTFVFLIFCVDKVTPQTLQEQFKPTTDKPCLSSFPCVMLATKCYLVSNKMPIDLDTLLDPLYAISLFLSQQQPSLFRHSHPEDATVQLLYKIAKDASIEDSNYESNFIDTINVICSTNQSILERAKNAIKCMPDSKKANRIIDRGLKYNLKVKRKFVVMDTDSDSSLEIPDRVPLSSIVAESSTTNEKEAAFVKEYRKNLVGRMNWNKCLAEGQSKSLFKRYSTGSSLRANFGSKN